MEIHETGIEGVLILKPQRFGDQRGFFSEVFRATDHPDLEFVQDNMSFSADPGTIRGLHFQHPPFAQAKLLTVARGSLLDVVVDIRKGSPTYGRHIAVRLGADDPSQILAPVGCLHGFCTLEPDTMAIYKVSAYYSGAHDAGVLWNDPDLNIPWPVEAKNAILSAKDQTLPRLRDLDNPFVY